MARAKRRPGPTFVGPLNKPIDVGPLAMPTPFDGPEDLGKRRRSRIEKLVAAQLEKMQLLAEHYSIDVTDPTVHYFELSLRLANDFVPGFWDAATAPRSRGTPKKGIHAQFLLGIVEGLKDKPSSGREPADEEFMGRALAKQLKLSVGSAGGKGRGRWPVLTEGATQKLRGGMVATDADACAIVAELLDPSLTNPSRRTVLKQRSRTLANRVGQARHIHKK